MQNDQKPTPRFITFLMGEEKKKKNRKSSRSHATMYFCMQNDQKPTPRFKTFLMGKEKDDRVKTGPRASTFFTGLKS